MNEIKQQGNNAKKNMRSEILDSEDTHPGYKVNKKILVMLLGAAVLVCLIYSNILNAPFIFDDIQSIRENNYLQIKDITMKGLVDAGFKSVCSNRPVANISFALNYFFHQDNVFGYHVTNIIIHLLTGLFLFFFLKATLVIVHERSSSSLIPENANLSYMAFVAILVWLVHPLNTQSVTYIVQRMNSMAAMFYILSMLCYVQGRLAIDVGKKYALFGGSILAGILSFGTKEISATLPVFIFLYEWFFFQDLDKQWLKRKIILIIGPACIIALLALLYIGSNPLDRILTDYIFREFTLLQRVMTEFRVVIYYLSLIFFPYPGRLNLDYDFPLSYSLINPPTTILALFLIVGCIIFAIYYAKKDKLVSYAILWFFGNLVIESSVIALELVYEHRTYLPSMFVIFLAVVLVNRYLKLKWVQIVLICFITGLFSFWTYQRNIVWQDEVSLWQDSLKKSPKDPRTHTNYAFAVMKKGMIDEAIVEFKRAIELAPNIPNLYYNLGMAFDKKGQIDNAIDEYQKALKLYPGYSLYLLNLGDDLDKKGSYEDAIICFNTVLKNDPEDTRALKSKGKTLAQVKRYDEALESFSNVLKIEPEEFDTYNSMGNVKLMQGKLEAAKEYYLMAMKNDPEDADAYNNLGNIFIQQGMYTEAITQLSKAVQLSPDFEKAYFNLATAYYKRGELGKAIFHYQEVLRINNRNKDAHIMLQTSRNMEEKYDASIAGMKETLKSKVDDPEAFYQLGNLYQRKGDLPEAIQQYEKALSLRRDFSKALQNLAILYTMNQEYNKAIEYLEEMKRIQPENPDIYYNMACIYSRRGMLEEAVGWLSEAIKRGFDNQALLETDPDLENVRQSEFYKEMMKKRR